MGPRILLNPFGYVRNTVHLGVSPSKRWGHGGIVIEMVFIDVVGPEPPVEAVNILAPANDLPNEPLNGIQCDVITEFFHRCDHLCGVQQPNVEIRTQQ